MMERKKLDEQKDITLTGMMFRITRFGFMTPIDAIPTPDLAVPYAAM
jgi:hypothetical protein